MCLYTIYGKCSYKAWYISYIPQRGAFDLNHRWGIYIHIAQSHINLYIIACACLSDV